MWTITNSLGVQAHIDGRTKHGLCSMTVELPKHRKELRISYSHEKEAVDDLEALYAVFPMLINKGSGIFSDSQIGRVHCCGGIAVILFCPLSV